MYQITNTNIQHGYSWANKQCGFVGIPKTANMQFRMICEHYQMSRGRHREPPSLYQFCVVRNPWTRTLSGVGEYRRRKRRWNRSLTWRGLLEELLETPERFDEHLEPQVAFMYDFTFTHIFKFENMLDEALQFPYFATGEGVVRAHLNPARAQRSQYLDLAHIQNENQELLDMIVAKYYSRDYEIWLNPDKFINKPVR